LDYFGAEKEFKMSEISLLVVSKEAWGDTRWARKQWLPYFLAQQKDIKDVVYVDRAAAWWRGDLAHQDEVVDGIQVVQLNLPFPLEHSTWVRRLNRKVMANKLLSRLETDPHWVTLYYHPYDVDMMKTLGKQSKIVFDWTEDWADFHHDEAMAKLQRRCVEEADMVLTVTQTLYQRAVSWRGSEESVVCVPNATVFTSGDSIPDEPEIVKFIPHPRLGFVGHMGTWFDATLVEALAVKYPMWQWVLIGGVGEQVKTRLSKHKNVHFLGVFSPSKLPALMQHCDVLVAPYKQGIQGDATKLYDYLAMKKPIVSTACETAERLHTWVHECLNIDDWITSITSSLEGHALVVASKQEIHEHHWKARSKAVNILFKRLFNE